MPANMKKAGIAYQKGGGTGRKISEKKAKRKVKKGKGMIVKPYPSSPDEKGMYVKYGKQSEIGDTGIMGTTTKGKGRPIKKMGGSPPNSKDFIGNPMGYYNEKAKYGREQMMKRMGGAQDDGFNAYTKMEKGGKVQVSKTKKNPKTNEYGWVSGDSIKTKKVNKNRAKRMQKRGWKIDQKY